MKNLISILSFLLSFQLVAQVPQKINYQGVIRNGAGFPMPNKPIGIKFQIHETGPSGPVVFTEQQSLTTNTLGLFSTQVGKVNNLATVTWMNGPYFMDIQVDTTGGSAYVFVGNQEIVSVPFALYAQKAGNAVNYSGSPDIIISGPPNNVITLSSTLPTSISVGSAGIIKSTIPKLDIDMNGRITTAGEYTANILGDVSGPLYNQTVTGLQGIPVSSVTPLPGQVLQFQSTGWSAVTPSASSTAGPWSYVTGNIFPSNNPLIDKVNIGQSSGNSLLNVLNNAGSQVNSSPVVNFSNSNSAFNAQGVLSVTNFSGSGACVYIQNNLVGTNSQGMIINMSNTLSSSPGLNVTHVGTGNSGMFSTTNPSNLSDALLVQSNSSGGFALKAVNVGTGAAFTASNNATAATSQFINSGTGSAIYVTSNGSSPGVISYNNSSGVAIHGYNQSTVASAGAHGLLGQTNNPSTGANGVIGINTNAGTAIYGVNNFTANASSFAHGVRGETSNTAAQASGVVGQNYGGGAGVTGLSTYTPSSGNANGVYGETNNSAVNSSGVFGKNTGTGNGVTGVTSSFATNAAGIYGDNSGSGNAVYGIKQGTSNGTVAKFDNLNASNNADAMIVTTKGTGAAISAVSGTAATSALSLLLTNGHIKSTGPSVGTGTMTVTGGFSIPGFAPILTNCTDVKGTISFSTAPTGLAVGAYIELEILFAKSYAVAPTVNLTAMNDMLGLDYLVRSTTPSGFVIRVYRTANSSVSGPTSIPTPATFKFNYFVIE